MHYATGPGLLPSRRRHARRFPEASQGGCAGAAVSRREGAELAFLAPQWTHFIQQYLGWDGLDEGLYWFLAHMWYVTGGVEEQAALVEGQQDDLDELPQEEDGAPALRPRRMTGWQRLVVERTPLTDAEREKGGDCRGCPRHAILPATRDK